jgi:hypothetical protein
VEELTNGGQLSGAGDSHQTPLSQVDQILGYVCPFYLFGSVDDQIVLMEKGNKMGEVSGIGPDGGSGPILPL